MIQLSLPITVLPPPWVVPRLIVHSSLIMLFSPMTSSVSAPSYFLSCGSSPIELNWNIRVFLPSVVRPVRMTCGPIRQPGPIVTSGPTMLNAPTSTSSARLAPGSTSAFSCMPLKLFSCAEKFTTGDALSVNARLAFVPAHSSPDAFLNDIQDDLVARHHDLIEADIVHPDQKIQFALLTFDFSIQVRQHTGCLRHGFDHQYAWHHGVTWKMTGKKRLVDRDVFNPNQSFFRLKFHRQYPVKQQEGITAIENGDEPSIV